MAFELAIYEDKNLIIAHTLTCGTVSTIERTYQSGPMVKVGPSWRVVRCSRCQPGIYVVNVTAKSLKVNQYATGDAGYNAPSPPPRNPRGPDGPNHATKHSMTEWTRIIHRTNPESSFPPYGVTALDITHSDNKEKWWEEAECKSDDERLGPWLERLFKGESNAHWTLTIQKVICSQCPVRAECLEQGVWGNETWGVWGGASERERRYLRRKWKQEGRIDERPNRPRNAYVDNRQLRGENGSGVAVARGDNDTGTREEPGDGEATSQDVSEVPVDIEVRWPRTYSWSEQRWFGEGGSGGGGPRIN